MSDRAFYLGKNRPMTWLRTWEEVESAAAGGLLGEHQWLELKEKPSASNKITNLELARDLASLSVDGGLLIFGVRDSDHAVVGCDVELDTLTSRVSQVASATIKPPLSPLIHDVIKSPADPDRYVLIVEVPASADAPHMVDDRYWGRSADGKRALSDPEVRRLLNERKSSQNEFLDELRGLVANDPLATKVEGHPTGQGHVYFLARPTARQLDLPDDFDPRPNFKALPSSLEPNSWNPILGGLDYSAHDPDGLAFASFPGASSDLFEPKWERTLTYASIKEDGAFVVVDGGATARWESPRGQELDNVFANRVALVIIQSMEALRVLSLDTWGYTGPWRVGVHITELQGKASGRQGYVLGRAEVPFANPTYTRSIVTSPATWDDAGMTAADSLLRGFFRGLGMAARDYETVLTNG